jgi:hypothetical protein
MGLLQKAESQEKKLPQKKTGGLISKAEKHAFAKPKAIFQKNSLLLDESHVFFKDFSETHEFIFSGILKREKKQYKLIYSFNLRKPEQFDSSKDFWDGTLTKKNTWNSFSYNEFAAFYQFFPTELHENLSLYFKEYNTKDNFYICFFASKNKSQEDNTLMINDKKIFDFIQLIDRLFISIDALKKNKPIISKNVFQQGLAVYSFAHFIQLENKILQKNENISKSGLEKIKELVQVLCNTLIHKPGFSFLSQDSCILVIFSNQSIDIEMLLILLKNFFSDYLHSSTVSAFEITKYFSLNDLDKIDTFFPNNVFHSIDFVDSSQFNSR